MSKIVLFEDKKDCCGCCACMNSCPKGAITMVEDEYGFKYPKIDDAKCVECGLCKTVCGYQNLPQGNTPIAVYAATAKNETRLKSSASGGAFATLAEYVLKNGGIVYGSSFERIENVLTPMHIRVEDETSLIKLQGSKYVQSDIDFTYKNAELDLKAGKQVLFSGTPCQIAGLKGYLKKDYENLLTADIICHGVPSTKFFHDFITMLEKKNNGNIIDFYFRDKSKGQGMNVKYVLNTSRGEEKVVTRPGRTLSYILFFSNSYTYRENCYSCKFASNNRVSDVTLGDFWGFHEEYPKISTKDGLSNEKGISCILVNTNRGLNAIHECSEQFNIMNSELQKVAKHNEQLHSPSMLGPQRETILEIYKQNGYDAVEKYFIAKYKKERLTEWVSFFIPKGFKRNIKKILSLLKSK